MVTVEFLANAVTAEGWLELITSRADQLGLEWVDLLIDQANLGHQWRRGIRLPHPPLELLADSAHADAAEDGPALLRWPLEPRASQTMLQQLFNCLHGQKKLVVLLSPWPLELLQAHLRYYLLAEWDQGLHRGVLRYYDPALLQPVLQYMPAEAQQHLLQAAAEWHWIDRDGHARQLDCSALLPGEWPLLPVEALSLPEKTCEQLSCWHQAELWQRAELLSPAECGVDSQEAMLQKLAGLQQAADQKNLWSQPEREAFLCQQLA